MSHDKFKWSGPKKILIDDFTRNTIPWEQKGGIAILHTDVNKTVQKLKDLGF